MRNSLLSPKEKAKIADFLSRPKTHKILTFLIVAVSITQFGKHFWPASSFVLGIPVDYLSPTLYAFDLLLLFFLFINSKKPRNLFISDQWINKASPLILFLLLNFFISKNPLSTLSFSLHFLLYLTALENLPLKSRSQTIAQALTFTLYFSALLALAQFLFAKNLGGIFYFLGERRFNLSLPNVAKATLFGKKTLRPYATFSHPNILAGWSVIASFLLYYLTQKLTWLKKLIFLVPVVLILFLTQSRTALFSFFILLLPLTYFQKNKKLYLLFLLLFSLPFSSQLISFLTRHPTSLKERLTLLQASLKIFKNLPLFGAGLNASISLYPTLSPPLRLLQPDHSIPTLILSQTGLFGLAFFFLKLKTLKRLLKPSLLFLLPLLLFDHYLATSTQALFLLLLLWKIVANQKNKNTRKFI